MEEITSLPTYDEAVKLCTPCPIYSAGSYQGSSSWSCDKYYHSSIRLDVLGNALNTPSTSSTASNATSIVNSTDLMGLHTALTIHLQDKLKQLNLNIAFINKRIRTRLPDCAGYINYLRLTTLDDFNRIKVKLLQELAQLPVLIDCYYKLIARVDSTADDDSSSLSDAINSIQQIDAMFCQLADSDDLSYVLKERSRVFNDARDYVLTVV